MTSMKTTTGLIRIRVKNSHLGPADLYPICFDDSPCWVCCSASLPLTDRVPRTQDFGTGGVGFISVCFCERRRSRVHKGFHTLAPQRLPLTVVRFFARILIRPDTQLFNHAFV